MSVIDSTYNCRYGSSATQFSLFLDKFPPQHPSVISFIARWIAAGLITGCTGWLTGALLVIWLYDFSTDSIFLQQF